MFTKLVLRGFSFVMRFGFALKVVPYRWDSETHSMVGELTRMNHFLFHLASSYYFFHISFLTLRAFQSYADPSISSTSLMLQLSLSVQSYMGALIQLNSVFRLQSLKEFITKFIALDQQLSAEFESTQPRRDILGIGLWIFTFFGVCHTAGFGFLFLAKPRMRHYYFSATNLANHWKYFFVPIEVLPTCYIWACVLIYLQVALMFMSSADYWVGQLAMPNGTSKTRPSLRQDEKVTQVYRSYQLLMNQFNYFVNFSAMQGQKLTNLGILVGSLYGTARFYDRLPLSAYATFPSLVVVSFGFANVAYQYGCIMNKASEKFRRSWLGVHKGKDGRGNVVASKQLLLFITSARDLKLKMGNFYYYDDTSARNFSQLGIDYAIGLLMAF